MAENDWEGYTRIPWIARVYELSREEYELLRVRGKLCAGGFLDGLYDLLLQKDNKAHIQSLLDTGLIKRRYNERAEASR